jgi:enediyne biosynthesis protein E4
MKTAFYSVVIFLFIFSSSFLKFQTPKPPKTLFTKITNSPVVVRKGDSRSVNWIDIDQDGDLDLYVTNGPEKGEDNFLYRNDGKGNFTAVEGDPIVSDGKPSDGATWADADNDGDPDCFTVNWYGVDNLFYENQGKGAFKQIASAPFAGDGGYSETAAWGDYDRDGLVDLYVANSDGDKRNFLYKNAGGGTFVKITTGAPATDAFASRCVNWVDYDGDCDADLFVANENKENENLYRNNGDGTFSAVDAGPLTADGNRTMSGSWGDCDNDGDLDVFLANDRADNSFFRNEGGGRFVKITEGPAVNNGGNSFCSQWADADNDGDLDLFVTNSFWGGPWLNFFYLNRGDGTFQRDTSEVVSRERGWSYGCAFGDYDRDGDLDLAVANCYKEEQEDYLYQNNASENGNRWIGVELRGAKSNRSAIGAKVFVTAKIGGRLVTQMREISAQSGYCGQNQLAAHFGLGKAKKADIRVLWPDCREEKFSKLSVNQYIEIEEGRGLVVKK